MSPTTAPAPTTRPSLGWFRRTLRLTRAEFTLFVRYKTAWLFLAMPLVFLFVTLQMPDDEVLDGVGYAELSVAGVLGTIGVLVGIGHASNVFTARRESLVLKRLRVSGVPPLVIFGATTAIIVFFSLVVAAVMVGLIAVLLGELPRDPLMLALAVVLSAVSMTMVGLLLTPFVRNAEGAQMVSVLPMMVLLLMGGVFFPLDLLPDTVRQVVELLPVAPAAQLAQAAYTGYDVFGGYQGAGTPGYLGLWAAALPSLLVLLAWTLALALAVERRFRWDPRQP
ncbi:ABC transporter permease [Nocardiopsis sp. EMB25]|uniref:ABC transporter permease n=1 Tax=Nocardiopsis TaxID=2013 RepID=UPI000346C262|nr:MULTISPECIES: ABC transporter permease [Nocardiopsis]MCY9786266.1 ABC transporter permease [Nocardiopsis sp. EMB25]